MQRERLDPAMKNAKIVNAVAALIVVSVIEMANAFKKGWKVIKWHPHGSQGDDELCCGILVRQAQEGSWNYCPFCGEKVPEEVIDTYDYKM